ncbi:hypothetical protein A2U01_0060374, partial [Trifolium medium]|nr:hypothetical protein [Trifolium medium]
QGSHLPLMSVVLHLQMGSRGDSYQLKVTMRSTYPQGFVVAPLNPWDWNPGKVSGGFRRAAGSGIDGRT